MSQILISWIGATDLRAADGDISAGLGPIGQATVAQWHDTIILLSNFDKDKNDTYVQWLSEKEGVGAITLHNITLSSPTNYGEIYSAAVEIISLLIKQHGADTKITFHLSPGTPAMAAVWIILSKTRFPASLIESSAAHGVHTVSIPFDISAEFLPDLLRNSDRELERMASGLPPEAPEFTAIIHRSEIMRGIILKARKAAARSIPVLIEGESGTGKELLARAIHDASPRRNKAFIAINCGAIPTELVESEFFGHEKGAFTGAITAKVGYFEAASGGTIFLDEIGELPKEMQVKLLRTLQEGEIRRIGATGTRKIDVRIIAATNRNLIEEIVTGSFREDLFYRLAVAVLKLPPLRERAGDTGLLIDNLIEKINEQSRNEPDHKHKTISVNAKKLLLGHRWPGNVRELQNTLTRAAVWSVAEVINEDDIRDALLIVPTSTATEDILHRPLENGINLPDLMTSVARHYLERAMKHAGQNKTRVAQLLGLRSYQTLTNWLKKNNLE
ncbi:MAG: sigma 54-interacting transcriptional regulator [Chlorobium sp.]|jgi:transcriptional regulator with PAS, ATPase and Fis domain|nr:sigma 54-interacting transcriptional regulator [Chlorobium sp.]